jgi:hypothetical protein
MHNLDSFVVIDPDSGTYFSADSAILLDTTLLSDKESELLIEGTDGDRGDLAAKLGVYLHDCINPNTLQYDKN